MIWHSVGEFFAMGGYALYVWGSFGVCALAMVIEPWRLSQRRSRALRSLQRELKAQQLNKELH
jgi:heme exporter protein D